MSTRKIFSAYSWRYNFDAAHRFVVFYNDTVAIGEYYPAIFEFDLFVGELDKIYEGVLTNDELKNIVSAVLCVPRFLLYISIDLYSLRDMYIIELR